MFNSWWNKKEMSIWYKFENLFEHGNLGIKHWKTTICERGKAVWVGVEMNEGEDKNGKH